MESMRDAWGRLLVELGGQRDDFVVLDADVAGGTGTAPFRAAFPDRFIQCGIAEQNMFTVAAGLAASGIIPVTTCYAFAALRAAEQVRNTIAFPAFPVKMAVSHLGLDVGPDGVTHQSVEDIAVFRAMPGLTLLAPADPVELAAMLPVMLDAPGPVYLRTGRSPIETVFPPDTVFIPGKAPLLRQGDDAAILAVGVMVKRALDAASLLEPEGLRCRVLDMSWLKPLDAEAVTDAARECGALVSCEDHNRLGGLGGAVAEVLAARCPAPLEMVALDDCYGESGEPDDLAAKYGLTASDIAAAVRRAVARKGGGR